MKTIDDASPHQLTPSEAVRSTGSDERRGLSRLEAERRIASVGRNELTPRSPEPLIIRLVSHLREPLAMLLIGAAIVSGWLLHEPAEALAIAAIVVLNVAIAMLQEARAEAALDALVALGGSRARVIRDEQVAEIDAAGLVPGDVVLLSEGDRVPADLRLLETANARIDESRLTGESLPIEKTVDVVHEATVAVAERSNMAFSSTLVSRGYGKGLVVSTGPHTEIGKIASSLDSRKPTTPLQLELGRLTSKLGVLAALAALATFALSVASKGMDAEGLQHSFLAAVALAVAAVPEGMATVVAVALALGVRRMAAQGAIVRSLPAVETLGSTTVIATDKTGTLTANELEVIESWIPESEADAQRVCAVCNDASLSPDTGDPLEIALLKWLGPERVKDLRVRDAIVARHPFDSDRKLMSVEVTREGETWILVKGAPEAILSAATDHVDVSAVQERMADYGQRGLKVIALAQRNEFPFEERQLSFIGLVALGDPLRPEARNACRQASEAGVKVIMVTGDHPGTAAAIARSAGLGQKIMSNQTLAADGFPQDPASIDIYARVTPQQKLGLVEALQAAGHVVAVSGDGVNDAPALHRAHIGVAMGKRGTDVAREAADLVITDDNLNTIVSAIREGRVIYDNIRKVVEYLIAANLAEVGVVLSCLLLFPELGVPLLPLQLLWINLVTDGLPAIGLGLDHPVSSVMKRPPRPAHAVLLNRALVKKLIGRSVAIGAGCVVALAIARYALDQPWAHARGLLFTTLALSQLAYAFVVRGPLRNPLTNRWLVTGVAGGFLAQVFVMAWSPLRTLFGASWLGPVEWLVVVAGAMVPAIAIGLWEERVALTLRARGRRSLRNPLRTSGPPDP